MARFEALNNLSDAEYLRDVGVSKEAFLSILEKVTAWVNQDKELNPLKMRGRKDSDIPLGDRLLLTFRYLRHYPTFKRLGAEFNISESYANKLYHRHLDILAKVLHSCMDRYSVYSTYTPISLLSIFISPYL